MFINQAECGIIHPFLSKGEDAMKTLIACGLAFLAFSAQADDAQLIDTAKQAIAVSLKDPAAQFKNLAVVTEGQSQAVCGEVNAKNSDGTYPGFTQFYKYADAPEPILKKGDVIIDPLVDLICGR
jgi:hypothetical protein